MSRSLSTRKDGLRLLLALCFLALATAILVWQVWEHRRLPEFADAEFRLEELIDPDAPISLALSSFETVELTVEPMSQDHREVLGLLTCKYTSSRRPNKYWCDRGRITVRQGQTPRFHLCIGAFAEIPRTDGTLELCKTSRYAYTELRRWMRAHSGTDSE